MTSPAAILFTVTIDSGTLWTDKENALSLLARFTLLLSFHVLFRVLCGKTRIMELLDNLFQFFEETGMS